MAQEVRCPDCGWVPDEDSHWQCYCGHSWNTFETRGQCPACERKYTTTQCLNCNNISGHARWWLLSSEPPSPLQHFQIALSFAGEDRQRVEPIAWQLRDAGIAVFYDAFEQVALWGENLVERLQDIYSGQAQYCVVFLSQSYLSSPYTRHERETILSTALRRPSPYILPVRLDDAMIPGLPLDLVYLDLRNLSPADLVEAIRSKLGVRSGLGPGMDQRFLVELESTNQFYGPGDIRMHELHCAFPAMYGGTAVSIIGCSSSPHRVQLCITLAAYRLLREEFLSGQLRQATETSWVRLTKIERPGAKPRQVAAVSDTGHPVGRNVVCHLATIAGHEADAALALQYIGTDTVSRLEGLKAFVIFHDDVTYVHTNFVKPGYDYATKIGSESGLTLLGFLINAVCETWPDYEYMALIKAAHLSTVEYFVLDNNRPRPGDKFFAGAANVSFVPGI
jgi:TIR domain